jgi:hypothetical protein
MEQPMSEPARLASRPFRWGRWLLLLWTPLLAIVYAFWIGVLTIPERYNPYNPWAPLEPLASPNALTSYKLARARGSPALCNQALAQTGMDVEAAPDRVTGPSCGFENAVRVRQANITLGMPLTLSCPMALSLAMWERHALQPAATRHFGEPVAGLEHLGSYACRNVNTGEGTAPQARPAHRSRHATANALDLAGLKLASGRRITVLRDFQRADASAPATPEASFWKDVHAGACHYFQGVLGPDYNAAHRDHLHLETGGFRMCR